MYIKPIRTRKIRDGEMSLEEFLSHYIKDLREKSVVVISSKVISIMENRTASFNIDHDQLVRKEADFIAKKPNHFGRFVTMKYNALVSSAGIDQSNGNGRYVLLPQAPQKTARKIYEVLVMKFKIREFRVIITDSRSMPLRSGAMGVAIGFCGFSPLKNYIGKKDLFGRRFCFERANIVDALAAVAVLEMGEGAEQTPMAIISNIQEIEFSAQKPTARELKEFYLDLNEDIFHQFYEKL